MAKMITPNFSVNEMTCKCGCGRHEMDGEFMRMLQTLHDEMLGPLRVSSGFRCEDHNEMVSITGRTGSHTQARATDILISGERAMVLFEKARQIGFSGIGLSQKGDHAYRFVHLGTLPRKALFSY